MMAECAIGQLRQFQKEFTVNDLIMCCGRLSQLMQAVELGGLQCKGQPACVYGKFLDDAAAVVQRMVENRSQQPVAETSKSLHQGKTVDYSGGAKVAEQLWAYIKPRLEQALKPDAVTTKLHEWFKLPFTPALKTVSTESLQAFAKSVEELLGSHTAADDSEVCEDNVDDDPTSSPEPVAGLAAATAMAKLADDVLSELGCEGYSIDDL